MSQLKYETGQSGYLFLTMRKPIQMLQERGKFSELGKQSLIHQQTACDMEKKVSQFKSGGSSDLREGLVCQYQFKGSASQFVFLRVDRETGSLGIDYSLSFSTDSRLEILCSCNGLLLLSCLEKTHSKYLVFDPFSNSCVPLPPHPCINGKILLSGLASNGNHFHVVLVHLAGSLHVESAGFIEFEIFSSSAGKWRRYCPTNLSLPPVLPPLGKSPNKVIACLKSKIFRLLHKTSSPEARTAPVYSNEAIYWEISGHLLVYQVKGDHCELIELPYAQDETSSKQPKLPYQHCLWESGGRVKFSYSDESGVHTWDLLNDEDHDVYLGYNIYNSKKFRWRLAATISHQQLGRRESECSKRFSQLKPCDICPITCIEALQLMYLRVPGAVISYNTDNHVMELVCTFRLPGINFGSSSFGVRKRTRENCCSFFHFNYAGLNSIQSEARTLEAATIDLPIGKLVNHVYF